MTAIKICGIRDPEHALIAAEAGADFIGLIFYPPSSRYVDRDEARAITDALQAMPARPKVVGVFVNEEPATMAELAEVCRLDMLQLSGDEPWATARDLSLPAVKALRLPPGTCVDDVLEELGRELPAHQASGGLCLIESQVQGHYGGTGQRADWALARVTARRYPFLLSGGLDPENVMQAVREVKPWGVDVSSGVETGGRKDPVKIRAFIQAVREADV